MQFTRKIKVRALLVASETEYVIYGDDAGGGERGLYAKMTWDAELWENGHAEDGGGEARVFVEFEIEVSAAPPPTITVAPSSVGEPSPSAVPLSVDKPGE